jgi:ElaB/YqjD/DUF883 family membrane-anchored ribosome-binding protein
MSAKANQFFNDVRDRLHDIDDWLQSVKTHIESLPETIQKTVQSKLVEARAKLQAEQERVKQTRANLKARANQDIQEIPAIIGAWRGKPVARGPNPGAVASHPVEAIDHAMASIDEVRDSMLYVAVARLHDGAS